MRLHIWRFQYKMRHPKAHYGQRIFTAHHHVSSQLRNLSFHWLDPWNNYTFEMLTKLKSTHIFICFSCLCAYYKCFQNHFKMVSSSKAVAGVHCKLLLCEILQKIPCYRGPARSKMQLFCVKTIPSTWAKLRGSLSEGSHTVILP